MKKNDEFISTCIDYDKYGNGVVRHEGIVFFVKGLINEEQAKIKCISMKKNYGYGKIVELIKISDERVEPKCSVFSSCGGCTLQHMSIKEQANFKKRVVENSFETIAKLNVDVHDVLYMEEPYRYRNKVQVPVQFDEKLKIGFYRSFSNDIVEFDDCIVQSEISNEIIEYIKKELNKYSFKNIVRHILIKHSHYTNEVMVVLIVKKESLDSMTFFIDKLYEEFNQIKSIVVNINNRKDNVILGDKEIVVKGNKFIKEKLCGFNFNISSKSFFQINPYQTEILYKKVMELADIKEDEIVLDLYCGIGTIGMIASQYGKKVIGIEVVKEAIKDAIINAKENNINNIEFYCMDAQDGADMLIDNNLKPDVIIVDPPRRGLSKDVIDSIVTLSPNRLIYVSCDPSTLARDCKIFDENGYKVLTVIPVDMFGLTSHVETVVLMSRVNK